MSTSLPIPVVPQAHTVATGVGHVAGVVVQWLSISTATCCTVGTHGLCLAYRHCRPWGSRSADPPNTVVVSCTSPCVEEVALRVPRRHVAHLTWPPASMTNLNHRTAGGNGAGQGRCRRRFTATLPITGYTDTWRDHQCLVPGILRMESIKGRIRRGIYNCKTHGWRSSQKMLPGT